MEKENNISGNLRKDDYSSPSARVIEVRTGTAILSISDPYTETQDGGNL